jgi:EmrB/QacA subfamily drug resistance transporter
VRPPLRFGPALSSTRHQHHHRSGSRRVIFGVTSLALLLVSIDGTVVATALPTLSRELNASFAWTAWTISAYQLGSVTALPVAGRLSDGLGRKRMFLVFAAIFTAASLCCGLVSNVFVLIALRFVQALGGGGLMPSATGVISDQFGDQRDRPIGLLSSIFPLGALVGPVLGGLIVTYFSWRLIFFVNVPIGVSLIAVLARLLPADPTGERGRVRIDVFGSLWMSLSILTLMIGINELGTAGWHSVTAWVLLGLVPLLVAGFLYRQEHSEFPVLPPRLVRRKVFVLVNGLNVLYGAAAFGVFSLVPLYAQVAYGIKPLEAGELLTFRAGAMAVLSAATSIFVLRRFGYRRPIATGFVVLSAGLVMLALAPRLLTAFTWLGLACIVCGAGIGIAGPPSNNAALELMPGDVAAISGLRAMFRQIGGIVAISITAAMMAGASPRILPVVFGALATLTILATPAISGVPENSRRAAAVIAVGHPNPRL